MRTEARASEIPLPEYVFERFLNNITSEGLSYG